MIIKTDNKTVYKAILHVKQDALQTFKPIMIQANQRNYSNAKSEPVPESKSFPRKYRFALRHNRLQMMITSTKAGAHLQLRPPFLTSYLQIKDYLYKSH